VLVDAYDNPNAASDLKAFDAQFGLPDPIFMQFYCYQGTCATNNPRPGTDASWALEEALDIEWAHAMAPNAQIYLVEAASNLTSDLLTAEFYAELFLSGIGGQVSNSWGSPEFSGEPGLDFYFNPPVSTSLVYTASSGDVGGVTQWPSTSPFVVSSGGTSVNRDQSGNFVSESCWSGSGGGPSIYEGPPAYQLGLAGKTRLTPDIAFDSDPTTGVAVYDSFNGGWFVVGGTSVAAPSLAGIINLAGNHTLATYQEQFLFYGELWGVKTYPGAWNDITTGSNGYQAHGFWDYCTGIGTPRGTIGK
jgi:subtilase family serine protease